jgi:hypothetical protein
LHVRQQDEGVDAELALEGAGFGEGGEDRREDDEGDGRLRMWYEWQVRREIGVRLERDDDEEEKREEEEEEEEEKQQDRVGCGKDVWRGCGRAVSGDRCKSERGELQAAQISYDCNSQYQNEGGMSHSIFLP